jgi:zinc and cadmium transporter
MAALLIGRIRAMASEAPPLLLLYSGAIVLASLLGGALPTLVRLTHTRLQVIMSFVAGLMLGVALYHLLPHSLVQMGGAGSIDTLAGWTMAGLVLMLLLLRLFDFHQHDFSEPGHQHDHGHQHGDLHETDAVAHPWSWLGIAFGLGLHTLIDGVALGAAVNAGTLIPGGAGLVGLGVFLAILLHKPLDALSITSLMQAGGWSRQAQMATNLGFALMCPLGAVLFYLGAMQLGDRQALVVGCALAFAAGTFLCIALSDLLPEVHFHRHDKLLLTAWFLIGIGLAWLLGFLEPAATHGVAPPG